jgi:hypothetical protein
MINKTEQNIEEKQMENKYTPSDSMGPIMMGSIVKYISLIAGVYSVARQNVNWGLAIVAGSLYLLGDILQKEMTEGNARERFSKLEEALTKNQTDKSQSKLEN